MKRTILTLDCMVVKKPLFFFPHLFVTGILLQRFVDSTRHGPSCLTKKKEAIYFITLSCCQHDSEEFHPFNGNV
jgi:hypothetical protein